MELTQVMTPYSTFWRRLWAGYWDAFVLGVPFAILQAAFHVKAGDRIFATWSISQAIITIGYSVLMHARYGQTIGKMWTGVIVLDVTETRTPTLKEAVLRDIGQIVPTATIVGIVLVATVRGNFNFDPDRYFGLLAPVVTFSVIWFLTELATMLTNSKRRALQDWIAGTVVMRKDSVTVIDGSI
jgi:uncharacterized RDD family membrane protein YckC